MPQLSIDVIARFAQFQDSLDKVQRNTESAVGRMEKSFRSLRNVLGGLGVGLGAVDIIKQLFDAGVAIQRFNNAMTSITGSSKQADASLAFLRETTKDLGTNLEQSLGSFTKFSAAAKGILSVAEIEQSFKSTSSAIAALSLSTEDAEGVFRAFTQVLSKGRLTAEEFRGQLGDRLPGAVRIFTEALGKTQPEIEDLLEKGLIPGREFVLKFTEAIEKSFPRATVSAVQELERLRNAWFELKVVVAESGFLTAAAEIFKDLAKFIQSTAKELKALADVAALFGIGEGSKGDPRLVKGQISGLPKPPAPKAFVKPGGDRELRGIEKKTLDADLRKLQAALDEEKNAVSNLVQTLDDYYKADLLNVGRYFQSRQDIIAGSLERTIALYDEEIEAVRKFSEKATPKEQLDAGAKIVDLIAKKQKAQADAAQEGIRLHFEETAAAQEYLDKLSEIRASLAEQQGDLRTAAELRFVAANRQVTTQAFRAEDEKGLGDIAALRKFTIATAELNELKEKAEKINENLATQERRLEIEREFGASTELDALTKTSEARQQAVRDLESIVSSYEAIAVASGNPKLIQDAQQLRTSLDELALQTDLVAQKFRTLYDDAIADFFVDSITGTKDLSEAFSDMVDSIVRDVARIFIQQNISGPIAGALGGFTSQLFHSGGVVGKDPVPVRLHSGIGPNEYPAVLQKGEAVFTKGQQRALSENMSSSNVIVNVQPLAGETAQVRERQDGSGNINIDVMIERVIESKLGANISRGKGIAPMLERVYGLSRTPGMVR